MKDSLSNILTNLEKYILREQYSGYDPYDGLSSPIFKLPILRSNKLIRFGFQQIFRRIPINLRPLLGIKKEENPVTFGLAIQAYTYLSAIFPGKKDFYKDQINYCIDKLEQLRSKGYSGSCWGYNFDWEARYAKIPAFTPTIVATGIISNGLYEYYKYSGDSRAKELILDSGKFVLNDLNRTYEGKNYCLSYSPNDEQVVFNASMKGARLLSQIYSISREESLKKEIFSIVDFVIRYQANEGYWTYSAGDARTWVDNFHTAYVLDALKVVNDIFKNKYIDEFNKGLSYYLKTFFCANGEIKYYSHKKYPIDATEVAQSIITLCNNKKLQLAKKVLNYGLKNLYSGKDYFYYRKYKLLKDKTSYMRWSNAWMFVGLSYLKFCGGNYDY